MQGSVACDKKSFRIWGVFNEFQSFIKPQGKAKGTQAVPVNRIICDNGYLIKPVVIRVARGRVKDVMVDPSVIALEISLRHAGSYKGHII